MTVSIERFVRGHGIEQEPLDIMILEAANLLADRGLSAAAAEMYVEPGADVLVVEIQADGPADTAGMNREFIERLRSLPVPAKASDRVAVVITAL